MPGEVHVGHEEKINLRKSGEALTKAAQGGGGVIIPGDVALQDMVWLTQWGQANGWTA